MKNVLSKFGFKSSIAFLIVAFFLTFFAFPWDPILLRLYQSLMIYDNDYVYQFAKSRIDEHGPHGVPYLLEALSYHEGERKAELYKSLLERDSLLRPHLKKFLTIAKREKDHNAQYYIIIAMPIIDNDAETLDYLATYAKNKENDSQNRSEAIRAMSHYPLSEIEETLFYLSDKNKEEDPSVRGDAIWVLSVKCCKKKYRIVRILNNEAPRSYVWLLAKWALEIAEKQD